MKSKKLLVILCAAMLILALAGCGRSSADSSSPAYSKNDLAMEYGAPTLSGSAADAGGAGNEVTVPDDSRKIIYTASLSVESKTFDDARAALLQAAAECGGYLESSNESGDAADGSRSAYFAFRIPAEKYSSFLNEAGTTGNVTYRSENTEDITANYVDVEARISNLEAQRTRLEELRDQAETLEDLLTIESKLSDVQYQLESYTAQMRLYDKQVDYCTVNVSLDEVAVFTSAVTFGSRILDAFAGTWSGFVEFLQNFVIALIYLLPYLILAGIIILIVRAVAKRLPKKPRTTHGRVSAASAGATNKDGAEAPASPKAPGSTPDSYADIYSPPSKDENK